MVITKIALLLSCALSIECFARQWRSKNFPTLFALKSQSKLPEGFEYKDYPSGHYLGERPNEPKTPIPVTSVDQLKHCISVGYRVPDLDVRGDTIDSTTIQSIHPVVKALYDRKFHNSTPGNRTDNRKIAIAVEGGGMRGCVAAGMITAFWYLGLTDAVDVVYGSSAGALVGAYFIAGQLPYFGPEVYYDVLPSAGSKFIDLLAVLRSCGLWFLDLRLQSILSVFKDRMGKPVLNLNYLFGTIVNSVKPLDWATFWERQTSNTLALKVVASGLLSGKAVVMSAAHSNFQTAEELYECMKASMLLPGITGEAIRLKGSQMAGGNIMQTWWREYLGRGRSEYNLGSEPLTDAQLYEPIPYRSALRENCTHVIALRTKPDGIRVTSPMSLIERRIMTRFFGAKMGMPHLVAWMGQQFHKLVYAEDILLLNAANRDFRDDETFARAASGDKATRTGAAGRLYCIAVPKGTAEVKRLETSRKVIFDSVRESFAAAYDCLVLDPADRGKGITIAREIWPDSILSQPLAHLVALNSVNNTIPTSTEAFAGASRRNSMLRGNFFVSLKNLVNSKSKWRR